MRRARPLAVALAALVLLGGCGDDDGGGLAAESVSTTTVRPRPDERATTSTTAGAPATTVAPEDVPDPQPPPDLGEDAALDRLAQECAAGQFSSCDTLFFTSPPDSNYEAYGDSCGGRNEPGNLCVDIYGQGSEPAR